jgi:hypothetical protein
MGCQIRFHIIFSRTIAIVLMKKNWLIIAVDDLDFEVKDVAFEANMFNRDSTFYWIANKCMEYQCYAYLQCDLLDRVALTIIIFKVKSLHIDMHEQYLQKYMFMKAKNFDIKLIS